MGETASTWNVPLHSGQGDHPGERHFRAPGGVIPRVGSAKKGRKGRRSVTAAVRRRKG